MKKTKNKHGPDIDIGLRMGWPRGPAFITGEPPPWIKIRYGPPDKVATRGDPDVFARGPDTVWPQGIPKGEKRKRGRPRDFVMLRRIGESPPKIVKGKNINYIDFKSQSNYRLTAIAMPKRLQILDCRLQIARKDEKARKDGNARGDENARKEKIARKDEIARKDAMTQRDAEMNFGYDKWMVSTTLDHRESFWMYGESLIGAAVPRPLALVPDDPMVSTLPLKERDRLLDHRRDLWMYGECSLGAAVPRPLTLVPFSKNNESIKYLKTLNN